MRSRLRAAVYRRHIDLIVSRVHPRGSSRSARPRASRCVECGRRSPTSPRSTSTRSPEESRTLCVPERGRGLPASMTAGVAVTSVVPRFRRFDADTHSVDASLQHILDEGRDFASSPCVLPRSPAAGHRELRTEAMAPATAQPVNRSPGDRLLPVARPRLRPAGGSSWPRIANWPRPATVTLHDGLRAYGRGGCAAPAKPPGTRWHRPAPERSRSSQVYRACRTWSNLDGGPTRGRSGCPGRLCQHTGLSAVSRVTMKGSGSGTTAAAYGSEAGLKGGAGEGRAAAGPVPGRAGLIAPASRLLRAIPVAETNISSRTPDTYTAEARPGVRSR